MRLFIKVQHVLHVPDEIACHLPYAPALLQPRFDLVFLSILCTLIWEMESTASSSMSLSARSLSVHFDLPSGGSEQARRVNWASTLPSIFGGAPLRGFSCNANSRPPSQYLFLIRLTVVLLTFKASTISSSDRPSSARSNILARVKLLADDFPRRRYWFSSSLSSSFNLTQNIVFLDTIFILRHIIRFKTCVLEHYYHKK